MGKQTVKENNISRALSKDTKNPEAMSAQALSEMFGSSSHIYSNIKETLENLWEEVKDHLGVKAKFDYWVSMVRIIYGYKPDLFLFIDHTYLVILTKIIVYLKLNNNEQDKSKIIKVVNGNFFMDKGIRNFLEEDFSAWLLSPKIEARTIALFWNLTKKLAVYNYSKIDEDIFREIYEDIVGRKERHKAGEYYTPDWLAQIILDEVIALWENKKGKVIPNILDPACGSGTFLYRAIKIINKKQGNNCIKEVVKNIAGIDINPLATIITKANYLIAISDLITGLETIILPVYTTDSLKSPDLFDKYVKIQKYDIIVGNPPWVVMRSMGSKIYQNFLKKETLEYHLLEYKDVHLFTQMELATLFFCKSADLYLKRDGIIAFIMPRSVLAGTIHHINFRKFKIPPIRLAKILDLEDVSPLFNIPSCVLIGLVGSTTKYPVSLEKYVGNLPSRNAKLSETKARLSTEVHKYIPPDFSAEPSYYFNRFKVGASIFPRSLYFIDFTSYTVSYSPISVKTSNEILHIVKEPWKIELAGSIEDNFLYTTLLAWEMIPFGYAKLRPVVLPIEEHLNEYRLLDTNNLQRNGFKGTAEWFKKAQEIWDKKRTKKSEKRFPSLLDRLNYNNLLVVQKLSKRYVTLYNATGTNLVSCVVDKQTLPYFKINGSKVKSKGFITDVKTWFFETDNETEAHYLSGIFNSEIISKIIKPLQPRGLFGARAIHRRPLLFPIPEFDGNNHLHIELADISRKTHEKVKFIKFDQKNNIRMQVRNRLIDEMIEINKIVAKLLQLSSYLEEVE